MRFDENVAPGVHLDTGVPTSWDSLHAGLRQLGRTTDDIEAVVLTHGHFDHVGFAEKARATLGVPVQAPQGDVPLTRHPMKFDHERPRALYFATQVKALPIVVALTRSRAWFAPPVQEVLAYADDAGALPVPGSPVVVPTPGHTYGHCALHLPERDTVIAGDAVVMLDPYTARKGPCIVAKAATAASVQNLATLDALAATGARHVLTGHGEVWHEGAEARSRRRAGRVRRRSPARHSRRAGTVRVTEEAERRLGVFHNPSDGPSPSLARSSAGWRSTSRDRCSALATTVFFPSSSAATARSASGFCSARGASTPPSASSTPNPHPDLNTPADNASGALDWMGVAHLLGRPGAVRDLLDLDGAGPAMTPANAIDFADLPICENTDRNVGLTFAVGLRAWSAAVRSPRVAAVTITEVNPHHGERDGSTVRTFAAGLASALAPRSG